MTNHSPVAIESKTTLPLNWVSVGFFGTIHVLALLAPWFFSWSALGVTIFLHWLFGGIGICLGYHRMLTHRSFQVPKWLEYTIATFGALAIQGGPIFWVANHRLHHAFTEDDEKDPYSANKGFWWSHMMWIFYPRKEFFDPEANRKAAPDLARDPYYRWLDRNFLLLQIPVGLLLYALGSWSFVVWGVFFRAVLLWHSTWLINSAVTLQAIALMSQIGSHRNLSTRRRKLHSISDQIRKHLKQQIIVSEH